MMPTVILQVDTTSAGYKVGYEIGSWLPFVLLAVLLWLMIRSIRSQKKRGPE